MLLLSIEHLLVGLELLPHSAPLHMWALVSLLGQLLLDVLRILLIVHALPLQRLVLREVGDGDDISIGAEADHAVVDQGIDHIASALDGVGRDVLAAVGLLQLLQLGQLRLDLRLLQLLLPLLLLDLLLAPPPLGAGLQEVEGGAVRGADGLALLVAAISASISM